MIGEEAFSSVPLCGSFAYNDVDDFRLSDGRPGPTRHLRLLWIADSHKSRGDKSNNSVKRSFFFFFGFFSLEKIRFNGHYSILITSVVAEIQ